MHAAWWWIDRWRKSTAYICLTLEEQGFYRNLLDTLWLFDGRPIPDEPKALMTAAGADSDSWARCWPNVQRWLTRVQGGWINQTALEMIEEAQRIAGKRSEAGKIGASARWQTHSDRNATAYGKRHGKTMPSDSDSDSDSEAVSRSEETPLSAPPGADDTPSVRSRAPRNGKSPEDPRFGDWYGGYPRKVGRSAAATSWNRLTPDQRDLALSALPRHVELWNREGRELRVIPHPATWLNGRRWEDEIPVASNGNGKHPVPTPFVDAAAFMREQLGITEHVTTVADLERLREAGRDLA